VYVTLLIPNHLYRYPYLGVDRNHFVVAGWLKVRNTPSSEPAAWVHGVRSGCRSEHFVSPELCCRRLRGANLERLAQLLKGRYQNSSITVGQTGPG
jgi:hypothetical protein